MSMKKLRHLTQLFIIICSTFTLINATLVTSDEIDDIASDDTAQTLESIKSNIQAALERAWKLAKGSDKKLMGQGLDSFRDLLRNHKRLLTLYALREQSVSSLQQTINTTQSRSETIGGLHEDLIATQAETQRVIADRNNLYAQLQDAHRQNNQLRAQLALTMGH